MKGCPLVGDWICRTKRSTRYFHDSTIIVIHSSFPIGPIVDQSYNSKMVGAGLRFCRPKVIMIVEVITLIDPPNVL